MNINGFFVLLLLAAIGLFFNSLELTVIALLGVVLGFALMSREAKTEKEPAVVTRPVVLNLPPEELENKWQTPDQMGMGFLPEIATAANLRSVNPFDSIPESSRQMLPFPNYGKSNAIERMFFGVPFIGHYIWNKVISKKQG